MLRRNVLIFHTGALGDFVLAAPLALGLGRALAQSRITFITHRQKGELAEKLLRLESADIESGWHALHAEGGDPLPPRAASLLAGAQAIYTFTAPSENWLANVRRHGGEVKIVPLSTRPTADFPGHASDWLLQQLADHPVERTATQQMLRSIAERGIGAPALSPAAIPVDVLIHPGSGSVHKCWPVEHFVKLADALKRDGRSVRFTIGEVERDRWTPAQLAAIRDAAEVSAPATYLDLLREIQSARLVIGNDSGPGHLAGIVGARTLSIFGPASSATQWKPLGPRVAVIAAESLDSLAVDAVMQKLREQLSQ